MGSEGSCYHHPDFKGLPLLQVPECVGWGQMQTEKWRVRAPLQQAAFRGAFQRQSSPAEPRLRVLARSGTQEW